MRDDIRFLHVLFFFFLAPETVDPVHGCLWTLDIYHFLLLSPTSLVVYVFSAWPTVYRPFVYNISLVSPYD
jgi:hypothetical protein